MEGGGHGGMVYRWEFKENLLKFVRRRSYAFTDREIDQKYSLEVVLETADS